MNKFQKTISVDAFSREFHVLRYLSFIFCLILYKLVDINLNTWKIDRTEANYFC